MADEDEDWEKKKEREKLTVEAVTGTVFEVLDTLEPVADKHMRHRSTLARQLRAALQLARERRPGVLSRDIDFGENYTIEEVRKLQSEHWKSPQSR